MRGGGSEGLFFGSEILAERGVLGSVKDAGIFLVLYFSSAQINNNTSAIYLCGIFVVQFADAKKTKEFFGVC